MNSQLGKTAEQELDDVRKAASMHKAKLEIDLEDISNNKKSPDHFSIGGYAKWMLFLTFYKIQGTKTRKTHKIEALGALMDMISIFKQAPKKYFERKKVRHGLGPSFTSKYKNEFVNPQVAPAYNKAFYGFRNQTQRIFNQAKKACQRKISANKRLEKQRQKYEKTCPTQRL